jgi:hypothetical protein
MGEKEFDVDYIRSQVFALSVFKCWPSGLLQDIS